MNDDNFQIIRSSLAISIQKLTELQPERQSVLLPGECAGSPTMPSRRLKQQARNQQDSSGPLHVHGALAVSESERRSIRLYGFARESDRIEMP